MIKAAKKINTRSATKGGFSKIKKYFSLCAASRGQTLVIATVFIAALLVLSLSIVNRGVSVSQENRLVNQKISARAIAEAGIEKAIYCLNQSVGTNCGGTFGINYVGENDISFNDGVFSTAITTIDSNTRSITSTGYIPDSSNPKNTVTIKTEATIDSEVINFNYGVQTGVGGINMHSSSKIFGNVYSNGNIRGEHHEEHHHDDHQLPEITGDISVASLTSATADQSDTTQNTDFFFGTSTPRIDIAQSFKISIDGRLDKISLYIKKVGSPSNVTVRILADNGGVPSKNVIESGTLSASQVTSNYSWVNVDFNDNPAVFSSETYWLSIDTSANSSKYWILGKDGQNGYALGKAMYSADWNAHSPIWADAGGDFNFKIWLGGDATSVSHIKAATSTIRAHIIEDSYIGKDAFGQLIDDSTILRDAFAEYVLNSDVSRNVYANSTTGTVIGGQKYPGGAQTDPGPKALPISEGQIQEWKDAAALGDDTGSIHLDKSESITIGPKKVVGDIHLDNFSSIKLTGPVWVTGSITLHNDSKIYIDPILGSQGTVLIATGDIYSANHTQMLGSGTAGSYLLVISEDTSIGQDDYDHDYHDDEHGHDSYDEAIVMRNSSSSAVLFAPYGAIGLYNSTAVKEASGYELRLYDSSTVSYETGLVHASFSSGPGGSWIIKKGTWQEL